MQQHVMWHQKHPNEDYQTCNICQQCGKVCTDYNAMKFHVRQVHCDRTLKCTHANCRKVFKTQVALKSHLDIHEGIKNFVCSECGFAFRSKQEMKGHMLRKHSHVKRSIPCEICGKLFRHMSNLKSHFNIHKQQSERQHRCKECNITFKSDVTLKTHMTLHDPSRPFKCSKCPLRYKNKVSSFIYYISTCIKVGFFSESVIPFSNLQKKIFQKTILNLKFKIPAHNIILFWAGILNFKFRIVFWNIFFGDWEI